MNTMRALVCSVTAMLAMAAGLSAQIVDPVGGGPGNNIVFRPGNDAPVPAPNHPPIADIPPMPMPTPVNVLNPDAPRSVTVYDTTTGVSTHLPVGEPSELPGEFRPGFVPSTIEDTRPEAAGDAFASMATAVNLWGFPQSGAVKLVMRFVDTGGTNRFFVCSGSMIDAGVVLTAAHCVYARNPTVTGVGVVNIFNWATEIWVYPAWDGVGSSNNPGANEVSQNWGWMYGTFYLAGTDYINNGNFDRDCGLVGCFDRSAGMITGWYGWWWGQDCSWVQSRTYYNFSYPAEPCSATLHTGRQMYIWSGTFDSCPGNQLQINTTGGCFNAGWGGMSGSGAYWYDGVGRFVHAVSSNSDRATVARYCKLWEQFSIDMGGFDNTVRGGGFDAEALRFRVGGSTTAQAGTSFAGSSVVIANSSNNDPPSQGYGLRVYLSTNNNIDSSDTLLATWNYGPLDFAPIQNWTFNVPGPFIPSWIPPGSYWLGVIVDAPGDVDGSNNDTNTWDAQQVTITPPPPFNDTCGGAQSMVLGSTYFGNSATAGNEGSTGCGFNSSPDVWYTFTPACSGVYEFTTCGSGFDTVLSLHSGCVGTTGNQIDCNDDDFNTHCFSGYNRDAWFEEPLTGGNLYYVRMSGYNGATGNFAVRVNKSVPANNSCSSAFAVTDGVYAYDSCGATTDGPAEPASCNFFGEPDIQSDLWFRYTAPSRVNVAVGLCGSQYDTELAIYGASCPFAAGSVIACNDDDFAVHCTAGSIRDSWVSFTGECGQSYLIRVGGYAGAAGSGEITISSTPACGSADFDGDGDTGTDNDIETFFACLGGSCCATCGSADFDGDCDTGTDADIEAFFRVLGGGAC